MTMLDKVNKRQSFREQNRQEFDAFISQEKQRFNDDNCLKVDLHCHDKNSDVPDELWGRILRLPETWLKTKSLAKILKKNGMDVITITNHNNARSCWDLIEDGYDVLVGAEFTCYFPEYELYVHVLGYGFDQEQEKELNRLRSDIYDFVRYAAKEDIPLILPHPLYFYTRNDKIDLTLFEKFAVLFQRFEVLNGQRDLWQSILTLNWTRDLTPEKIITYGKKHNLDPLEFGVDPYRAKILTGGSDDHTGIFSGQCGSRLYVENLQERLKHESPSQLALEAIKKGNISPFGRVAENQKLTIALLDYFSQVVNRIKDPGLFRILLHRGTVRDKVGCFILSNLLLEMQEHKKTLKFFDFVHKALHGEKMSKLTKWKIAKDYRFCIRYLEEIAESKHKSPEEFIDTVNRAVRELFTHLNELLVSRVQSTIKENDGYLIENLSTEELTRRFEIPSQLTALFFGNGRPNKGISNVSVERLLDKLTFPVLISLILAGASMASTRVLYQNRKLLDDFADYIGKNHHQKRALHLSDTWMDKNGVSSSLKGKLEEIQKANLPIDFLICHPEAEEEDHLHVVRPIARFTLDKFGGQEIRIPNLMEIAQIFYEGGYDRIICSTEGPMAFVALYIQQKFNVPSYFFMHTDWISFIKNTTDLNQHERDRVRRLLRAFYNEFDGIFVLNSEHKNWLISHEMDLDENKIHLTAHHTYPRNHEILPLKKSDIIPGATNDTPTLFIACRISKEKGILELPEIVKKARQHHPDLKLVVAGSGPATEELLEELPDTVFLGWQSKEQLAALYQTLDLFVFPSKFDTFGNVILEAFIHGMPVVAYDCKGPKDIIINDKNGYLVETIDQMANKVIEYFSNEEKKYDMIGNALTRAQEYQAEPILSKFIEDLGLGAPDHYLNHKTAAE